MKKLLAVMAVFFLVAVIAVPSYARGWRGHGDGPCRDVTKIPGLNLTVEQKTKLAEMQQAHQKDVKPLHDKIFIRKGDLRLLWQEKSLDEAKIRATEKEIRSLRDQLHEKRTSYKWAVYKMLTPEQREKIRDFGPSGCRLGSDKRPGQGYGRGPGDGFGPGYGPRMMSPGADRTGNN